MDLVGLLTKSVVGFKYILVIVDYATWFPEAIPLWNIMAQTIAGELLKIFCSSGPPPGNTDGSGHEFDLKTAPNDL